MTPVPRARPRGADAAFARVPDSSATPREPDSRRGALAGGRTGAGQRESDQPPVLSHSATQTRPVAVPKPQPQNWPLAFRLASWQ